MYNFLNGVKLNDSIAHDERGRTRTSVGTYAVPKKRLPNPSTLSPKKLFHWVESRKRELSKVWDVTAIGDDVHLIQITKYISVDFPENNSTTATVLR